MDEMIRRLSDDVARLEEEIVRDEKRIADRRQLIQELKQLVQRYQAIGEDEPSRPLAHATLPPSAPGPELPRSAFIGSKVVATHAESRLGGARELARHSIVESAKVILGEHDDWMDYADVADAALNLGYRSQKSGDDRVKIVRSFYELMRRHPELFDRDPRNKRRFRLKIINSPLFASPTEPPRATSPPPASPREERPRIDLIEDILREREGGMAHINEIMDGLNSRGDGVDFNRDAFWRTVDSALRRGQSKGRIRKVGPATWALADFRQDRPIGAEPGSDNH